MKQEVFVIGRDLRDLVPFSLTFCSPEYSVTLIETRDVVRRATSLAQQHHAWFLLILSDAEELAASACLDEFAPASSMIIEDGDDPVIALAHLIAATSWETAVQAEAPAGSTYKAQEQYG